MMGCIQAALTIILLCLPHPTGSLLDVTLVVPTPIVTYNEDAFLKCVGEDDYFQESRFPFAVEADIGTGTDVTQERTYGEITPETWPGRQIHYSEKSGPFKYGITSCTALNNATGEETKATGLIMSKNALVFPANLNYRASSNDSLVMNVIQARRQRYTNLFWYHIPKNKRPQKVAQAQLRISIMNAKEKSSGTYVIFYQSREANKYVRIIQQGLARLLVRACVEGKYGEDCGSDCPPCENGAVCDDKNGTCICPPGFMGPLCEIGCGPNKFGARCQHECSANDMEKGCKDKLFCLPDPYGCSCATGYNGIICSFDCSEGMYGHTCLLPCHCQQDKCDRFTGNCTFGCADGWTGVNCQKPCDNGTFGPGCNETCGFCSGNSTCDRFTGHCPESVKQANITSWKNTSCVNTTSFCLFGYFPPLCKDGCPAGTWGLDCANECHCSNRSECDLDDGFCPLVEGRDEDELCDAGWRGRACNETCEGGFYGKHCESQCGNCISDSPCHHITGLCVTDDGACAPGYVRKECVSLCDEGYFGANCTTPCNCANGTTCDPITGSCDGFCQAGFAGNNCSDPCPHGTYALNCTQKCGHCQPTDEQALCDPTFGKCAQGCTKAWSGEFCRIGILCSQNPCYNNGSCVQTGDFYSCHCTSAYSGAHCEILNPPCESSPCLNNGSCAEVNKTGYSCNCTHPFTGNNCEENENEETNEEATGGDDENSGSAAAIVLPILLVLALALGAAFLLFKKNRKRGEVEPISMKRTDIPQTSHESLDIAVSVDDENRQRDGDDEHCLNNKDDSQSIRSKQGDAKQDCGDDEKQEDHLKPSSERRFFDKTFPTSKETIAHVSPLNHESIPDESEEDSAGTYSSTPTQEKLSVFTGTGNGDVANVSPFSELAKQSVSAPFPSVPDPPSAPSEAAKPITLSRDSGNRKVSRRSVQLRFSKSNLDRLSEISLHNFYNNPNHPVSASPEPPVAVPTETAENELGRFSKVSVGGCALDPWESGSAAKPAIGGGPVIYGVSRRDSTLLITSPRNAEEEFEMESRKGSVFGTPGANGTSLYIKAK